MKMRSDQDLMLNRQDVIVSLETLLADEHVIRTRLWKCRWNVVGMDSIPHLQRVLERQLGELNEVISEIAGYLHSYSTTVPGTMREFIQKSRLSEDPRVVSKTRIMVKNLVADHESIVNYLKENISHIDETSEFKDVAYLMINLSQQHQKMGRAFHECLESQAQATRE